MKKNIFIICFLCLAGCASVDKSDFVKVKYTTESPNKFNVFEKMTFIMYIPKGYKFEGDNHSLEYKEHRYIYGDMCIYVTDNIFGGSTLNIDNKIEYGFNHLQRQTLNDTIYMAGRQRDGRYWRENILGNIVVGYVNVPEGMKDKFGDSINTLRKLK